MASLDTSASISATMFLWGIPSGVGANLGPFSKMDRSQVDRGLLERLIAHSFLSDHWKSLRSNSKHTTAISISLTAH
jgi:hypothetical protein